MDEITTKHSSFTLFSYFHELCYGLGNIHELVTTDKINRNLRVSNRVADCVPSVEPLYMPRCYNNSERITENRK